MLRAIGVQSGARRAQGVAFGRGFSVYARSMEARSQQRSFKGWYALLVFVAALGWRLPYTLTVQSLFLPETAIAHPTIAQVLAGEAPLYLSAHESLAPVQEWLSAGTVSMMGETLQAVRLPCVLLGCLAIALNFLLLARMVRTGVALALVVPLICANSYTGIYTTFGLPTYAVAMLCVAGMQLAAMMVDHRRSLLAWVVFGVLGGLGACVSNLLLIPFAFALLWAFGRSQQDRKAWTGALLSLALAAGLWVPWEMHSFSQKRPLIAEEGTKVVDATRPFFKPATEWPTQAKLFLERGFATFLSGQADQLRGGEISSVNLSWRAAMSGGLIVLLLCGAVARWAKGARPDWKAPGWLVIAPAFATILILLPTWQFNSDWGARCLIPFQAGIWMAVYWVFAPWIDRFPRIAAAFVAVYAGYCGLDTYWHTPL